MKNLAVLILLILLFSNCIFSYNAVLYNGAFATPKDRLLVMTLAGIVNRDSSRLYLLNVYETWSYRNTDEQWRDIYRTSGNVKFDTIVSVPKLIERFRSFIKGGITYDPNRYFGNFSGQSFMWQGEYACLIGGLTDRLPVAPSDTLFLKLRIADSVIISDSFDGDPPVWVSGRLESADNPWNNGTLTEEQRYLTMLNWGTKIILPRCNPKKFYIREITDFTIQKKMFQVNLAGTDDLNFNSLPEARADILEYILNYFHGKNPNNIFHIYGWMRPEPMVQWFACFGASFHETLLGNLSWHSSFPIVKRTYTPPALQGIDTLTLQNKYYLTFIGTEGDASNWNLGFQAGAWLSSERGNVPVNWGWNLHLLDECPFVASYYYDSATPNDGFISVSSPLGYAYPDLWTADVYTGAVDSSKSLMNQFGINNIYGYKHYAGSGIMTYRGKTISNSFNFQKYMQFQKAIGADLTIVFDPLLTTQRPITNYGSLLFNHCCDGTFYGNATNLDNMALRIVNELKVQKKPSFMLAGYQRLCMDDYSHRVDPSESDISLPRLKQLIQKIKNDPSIGGSIEVVTIEKFSRLMNESINPSQITRTDQEPGSFTLSQNYPNPFNPATMITYFLPEKCNVEIRIFDIMGNEIIELINKVEHPGKHQVLFDAGRLERHLSSGIYIYRISAGNHVISRKMLYLK